MGHRAQLGHQREDPGSRGPKEHLTEMVVVILMKVAVFAEKVKLRML